MVQIKIAKIQDLNEIKNFMLNALQSDPLAFSVNADEYALRSDYWWDNYLSVYFNEDRGFLLLLMNDEEIIGSAGIIYDPSQRRGHVCSLVWVFVQEEFRMNGYSKMLLGEIFKRLELKSDLKKISLYANIRQNVAIKLYKNLGFVEVGHLKDELKINDEYIDVLLLEKYL